MLGPWRSRDQVGEVDRGEYVVFLHRVWLQMGSSRRLPESAVLCISSATRLLPRHKTITPATSCSRGPNSLHRDQLSQSMRNPKVVLVIASLYPPLYSFG
jgi:hypothetical protein